MQSPLDVLFHPLDLRECGRTPSGLSLYRVVWADSRLDSVLVDGRIERVRRYSGQADGKWVLEKWLSAEKLMGMGREHFATFVREQGVGELEWPSDGDYELVLIFEDRVDTEKTRKICTMIEFDQANNTNAERAEAVKAAAVQREKDADSARNELVHEVFERKVIQ